MTKLQLPKVTLVCADDLNISEAIEAIEICKYYADFKDIKFFTDADIDYPHKVEIPHMGSYSAYSSFIFKKLLDYLPDLKDDEFVLVMQHDGFILNPDAWTDDFLKYDYIGAEIGPDEIPAGLIGNGGFSLRSKRMLELCKQIGDSFNDKDMLYSEDLIIAWFMRDWFDRQGAKIAPLEIAEKFSSERKKVWNGSFGFHQWLFVDPYKDGWVNPLGHDKSVHNIDKYLTNLIKNQNG